MSENNALISLVQVSKSTISVHASTYSHEVSGFDILESLRCDNSELVDFCHLGCSHRSVLGGHLAGRLSGFVEQCAELGEISQDLRYCLKIIS